MRFYMLFLIFIACICYIDTSQSAESFTCLFPNNTKKSESEKLMNIISSIVGHNFPTEKDSYSYVVSICSDAAKDHELGAVIRRKNNDGVVVLGRRNDTKVIAGNNWMVLVFGSGDYITEKNVTKRRSASVYLVCNPDDHDEKSHVELVQEDGRNYIFTLPTHTVCQFHEEMSGMKIFLMILTMSFTLYCLVGITYKRFVQNAQHCQQIPHSQFWTRLGNKLADGCDFVCRHDTEPEDSWNTSSNFENGDRDDALLRP